MSINSSKLNEVSGVKTRDAAATLPAPIALAPNVLGGVKVTLEVQLGEAVMTVDEMMALKTGAVVTLQTPLGDHADVLLNGVLIARGEIVAVGEHFGVRIAEIVPNP